MACCPQDQIGANRPAQDSMAEDDLQAKTTAQNPNFVADYFSASRLHFIGSFRARYESMMVAVAKRLGKPPQSLLKQQQDRMDSFDSGLSSSIRARERVIVHIDMDAFFASVAVRDNPSLFGKPVAVCHSTTRGPSTSADPSSHGGEISSCSYEARAFGVRAGMFYSEARKHCPALIAVPYDFAAYELVSISIYSLFYSFMEGAVVQAQSVDEAYIDLTPALPHADASVGSVEVAVRNLRDKIFAETGCRASAGIGPSKLIARLATSKAKPDGQLIVRQKDVMSLLTDMPVRDLPGIGWRTEPKLRQLGIQSCGDLRTMELSRLQAAFGEHVGRTFYELCRGVDSRIVQPMRPRKSIGAEASWGVRFGPSDGDKMTRFIIDMANEVAARCLAASATGRKVIYKAYRKKIDAGKPGKYLGHGPCDILTKSCRLECHRSDTFADILSAACLRLHISTEIPPDRLRGVGVQVCDLIFQSLGVSYENPHSRGGRPENVASMDQYFGNTKFHSAGRIDSSRGLDGFHLEAIDEHTKYQLPLRTKVKRPRAYEQSSTDGISKMPFRGKYDQLSQTRDAAAAHPDSAPAGKSKRAKAVHANLCQPSKSVISAHSLGCEAPQEVSLPKELIQSGGVPCADWDPAVFHALPTQLRLELSRDVDVWHTERCRIDCPKVLLPSQTKNDLRQKSRINRVDRSVSQFVKMNGSENCTYLIPGGIPAGWDASVFAELPSNVQKELIDEQEQHALDDGMEIPSPPSLSSGSQVEDEYHELTPALPNCKLEDTGGSNGIGHIDVSQGISTTRVFGDELLFSYAPQLRLWMESTASYVRSGHVELLRGRLLEMVEQRKLSAVFSELATIRVFASKVGQDWIRAFNVLLREVQNEVRQFLGTSLLVKPICPDMEQS